MNKIVYLVVVAGIVPAAASPAVPYSQDWGNHLADVLHRASDEAEACAFASAPAKSMPADFNGITKVKLLFAADGAPDSVAVVQSSGNAALDRTEVECWRSAPHLRDVGQAMLPEHAVTVVSDWQALRRKH